MPKISYEVRQSDDGSWKIDTAQAKGNVTHMGVLPESYDSEAAAKAAIKKLEDDDQG